MSQPDQDPLAAILSQAEADRRRERAAAASAGSVSTPVSYGDATVAGGGQGGLSVTLDANGRIPPSLLYPAAAGQVARSYEHVQSAPAAVWTIPHNLGGYPPPVVIDDSGSAIDGEVRYVDENTMTVTFGRPKTGRAHVSL